MTDWYERRQRADRLAAALRDILSEADDLAGIALASGDFGQVLASSARDLREQVADLVNELRGELEPAASVVDPEDARPASPQRVARLLWIHADYESRGAMP